MANRFVRRIRSGDIGSVEELKSEFKELAKLTHPDLREGEPGAGAEFASVRAEYEAALSDFEKHRFEAAGVLPAATAGRDRDDDAPLPGASWLCLELLLKRGFPKVPRHHKEGLRYDYARWRLVQALGPRRSALFGAFEAALLDLRARAPRAQSPAVLLLSDLIDYRYARLPPMRTDILLALGRLRADPGAAPAVGDFLGLLALDLGLGGELDAGQA